MRCEGVNAMIEMSMRERGALLVLMASSRSMTNPELSGHGVGLDSAQRTRLNDAGLLSSSREGRSHLHELTDQGWRWCADELGATCPPRAGSAGGALYAVLAGVRRYVDAKGLALADVFRPDPEAAIRRAYTAAARRPGDWVALADLRPRIEGVSREAVDAALGAMFGAAGVNLAPEVNSAALTDADHAAALRIGAKDVHMLAIGAT